MAFRTTLLLSIITLNNSQSSKETFKPKGVTSGACLRAHKKAENQNGVLGEVEHAEEHGTECQVGIRRLAQRGKKQP